MCIKVLVGNSLSQAWKSQTLIGFRPLEPSYGRSFGHRRWADNTGWLFASAFHLHPVHALLCTVRLDLVCRRAVCARTDAIRGLGQMGRSFFVNMMIFQCWGLLYAILQSLMSALQITTQCSSAARFFKRLLVRAR